MISGGAGGSGLRDTRSDNPSTFVWSGISSSSWGGGTIGQLGNSKTIRQLDFVGEGSKL